MRSWSGALPVAFALALTLAMWISNEWSHRDARMLQASVAERTAVRVTTHTVLRRLVEAENAQRGYLLTGRDQYLGPYRNADADVTAGLARVRAHFADEPSAQSLLDALAHSARDKLAELAATISMYDAGDHAGWSAVLASDRGQQSMLAARTAAEQLLVAEDRCIDDERAVINELLERDRLVTHAMSLLAMCGVIFFVRKNRALQSAQAAHANDLREQRDRLEAAVVSRTAELRELTAHLQEVREVERGQFARQLHDELGALLTAAKLDLARLRHALPPSSPPEVQERLLHLNAAIDRGVALKRQIIEELSPSALHNLGLRTALEILASEFRQRSAMNVTLDVEDLPLPESPRIAVFRMVQECLNNVRQHAAAHTVSVIVRRTAEQVLVQVRDSGRGFDPTRSDATRHGLRDLRHRIEALGGRFFVISAPGRGTEVEARLPLPTAA
jgi:signal transduction histidine kinase